MNDSTKTTSIELDDRPIDPATTDSTSALDRVSDPAGPENPIARSLHEQHRRLHWLWKTVAGVVLLVALFAVANYIYQGQVVADIDPGDVQPLDVTVSGESNTGPAADASLPAGSFTAGIDEDAIAEAAHPLEPLVEIAREVCDYMESNVQDYTAVIVKQVRANGKLGPEQYMQVKIRHARKEGELEIPFSVYTRFLKPRNLAGQEAIWVEGRNDDKIVAHPPGLLNLVRVTLDPESEVAMKGNRYSIRHIGMLNLIRKMLEKSEIGMQIEDCEVKIERGVQVDSRKCSRLEIVFAKPHPEIDFHMARIYIDDERNIPIAYEGYLFPEKEGDPPPLLEKYFYTNVQLNVGLTDEDFDPDNPEYRFPGGE